MKKENCFCLVGTMWMFVAGLDRINVWRKYGSGTPNSTEEWIAEALIGFLLVSGTTLVAVGRWLGNDKS